MTSKLVLQRKVLAEIDKNLKTMDEVILGYQKFIYYISGYWDILRVWGETQRGLDATDEGEIWIRAQTRDQKALKD